MIPIDSPCFFPWKSLQFGPVVANQATHHHTVEARDQRFAREIEPGEPKNRGHVVQVQRKWKQHVGPTKTCNSPQSTSFIGKIMIEQ
jgi:hypothetical protein